MRYVLPIGITHQGTLLRDFTLTRPTGALRGELRDAPNHIPGMDLVAFKHVVKTLGVLDHPNDHLLRKLTQPDVQYLHACCTAARFNGTLPVKGQCPMCDHKFEDSVNADQVAILDADATITFQDDQAVMTVETTLPSTGSKVQVAYRIPTLGLEIRSEEAKKRGLKESAAMYQRLADSILSIDGKPAPSARQLQEMDLDDLDAITAAMDDVKVPHLDDEALLLCPECGAETKAPVLFEWWILPFDPRKAKKP